MAEISIPAIGPAKKLEQNGFGPVSGLSGRLVECAKQTEFEHGIFSGLSPYAAKLGECMAKGPKQ